MSETYYKISRAAFEELGDAITDQGGTRPSVYEGSAYASAVRQLSILSERFIKKAIKKTIVNINSPAVISCAIGRYDFPYLETINLPNVYELSDFYIMSNRTLKTISFEYCEEIDQHIWGQNYSCFADCTNLSNIYFPNLKVLDGNGAFQNTAISRVYFPKIEHIKSGPFNYCWNLEEFSGNSSGYHIHDDCAFNYCQKLSSVDFSHIAEIAGHKAFYECPNLPSDITLTMCSRYCGVSAFGSHVETIRLPALEKIVEPPFRSAWCKNLYINADTLLSSTAMVKSCPNLEKIVFMGSRPSGFMEPVEIAKSCPNLKELTYNCNVSIYWQGHKGVSYCSQMSIVNLLYSSVINNLSNVINMMFTNDCPLGRHEGIINLPESLFSDYMSYYSSISWLTSMFSIYSGGA